MHVYDFAKYYETNVYPSVWKKGNDGSISPAFTHRHSTSSFGETCIQVYSQQQQWYKQKNCKLKSQLAAN